MRISDWSSDVCSSDLWFLANILIAREARVYGEQKTTAGGWNGWRDFRVEAITRESSVIKSFILRPADGSAVMTRSEEHTSELQSLMRISYAVFCLKKKKKQIIILTTEART